VNQSDRGTFRCDKLEDGMIKQPPVKQKGKIILEKRIAVMKEHEDAR
jgi:hypothetical protein